MDTERKRVRLPCVYNSPPWVIWQLNINELATLWDVPMLLQEKWEELDKNPCWFNFFIGAGENVAPSQWLLNRFEDTGGWCSIPCIDLKVKVKYTVIQQVLSTSVLLPSPMMEDEVVGSILKIDVHKEDDVDPPVALWDSWFYRSWKNDRAMIQPLAENRQQLLGIFWKFSLRWRKRRQIRSWTAFGKRYKISSYITHKKWIKGRSISHINQDGGVENQQVYQWYGNGRDSYIRWCSQRRELITIPKDCYLSMRECMKRIAKCLWW